MFDCQFGHGYTTPYLWKQDVIGECFEKSSIQRASSMKILTEWWELTKI